jgi:hypothetical protein
MKEQIRNYLSTLCWRIFESKRWEETEELKNIN